MDRFFVSTWHGEGGSIAEVRDRMEPDRCMGLFSTVRHGAEFRETAQAQADRLNQLDRSTFALRTTQRIRTAMKKTARIALLLVLCTTSTWASESTMERWLDYPEANRQQIILAGIHAIEAAGGTCPSLNILKISATMSAATAQLAPPLRRQVRISEALASVLQQYGCHL